MKTAKALWQEIWLIRHGVSMWNKEQIHQGQSFREPGLAPEGKNQAAAIAQKIKGERVYSIHCSPLPRTIETARAINEHLSHPTNISHQSGLMEITHGVADGISYEKIFREYAENWQSWFNREMTRPCFPGGESQIEAQIRMVRTMFLIASSTWSGLDLEEKFYTQNRRTVVVSHGGVNKLFLAHVLGLPAKDNFDIPQENACINILLWDGNNFLVKTDEAGKLMINLTDHLGEHRMSPNIKV